MRLRLGVSLMAVALAGCGTRSFVVPAGNGVYAMSGSSAILTSGAEEQARLVKHANDYCRRSGMSAVVVEAQAADARPGTLAAPGSKTHASIEFRCK